MPQKISILIVDDHPMVREGLAAMLTSRGDFSVATLAKNGLEALSFLQEHKVSIVLSDVRMPQMNGFELLEKIKAQYPQTRVLLLAGMPLKDEETRAHNLGAAGYLPKDVEQDRLINSLFLIARDDNAFITEAFVPAASILTAREEAVLRLIADGESRDAIANDLDISPETVKTHVRSILTKFNVGNSTAAVAHAYELGILRA